MYVKYKKMDAFNAAFSGTVGIDFGRGKLHKA